VCPMPKNPSLTSLSFSSKWKDFNAFGQERGFAKLGSAGSVLMRRKEVTFELFGC